MYREIWAVILMNGYYFEKVNHVHSPRFNLQVINIYIITYITNKILKILKLSISIYIYICKGVHLIGYAIDPIILL